MEELSMDIDDINSRAVYHSAMADKHKERASELSRIGVSTEPGDSTEDAYSKSQLHHSASEYHDKASGYYIKASQAMDDGRTRHAKQHVDSAENWAAVVKSHEKEHGITVE